MPVTTGSTSNNTESYDKVLSVDNSRNISNEHLLRFTAYNGRYRTMTITRFNIRVYLLIFNEANTRILLSDEIINGEFITKFPGGGLEYGEGILDCLHREAIEELGQEVEVIEQYYTTERFQTSMFRSEEQIICVYYRCLLAKDNAGKRRPRFRVAEKKFDFVEFREREESFRWQAIESLVPKDFSLPLDQQIAARLSLNCERK